MLKCERNARYIFYIYSFSAAVAFKQREEQHPDELTRGEPGLSVCVCVCVDSSCSLLLLRRAGKPSVNNNAYLWH